MFKWINNTFSVLGGDPAKLFFEKQAINCSECGYLIACRDSSGLEFRRCPRCEANNFLPLLVGDFMLFKPVGAGGNASVYQAHRRNKGKQLYAVKLLTTDHPDVIANFFREAQIHYEVSGHPNIAEFGEYALENGRYYYAMEHVMGHDISHFMDSGPLSEPQAFIVAQQLVSALLHIHEHGYLYRDISVGNLLIREQDGSLALIDFGLALANEDAATIEELPDELRNEISGTPEFVPPERVHALNERADSVMYSVGLLIYFMLTKEPYHKSDNAIGILKRHVTGLRLKNKIAQHAAFSKAAGEIIDHAIQPEPADRYQTFEQLGAAIGEHIKHLHKQHDSMNLKALFRKE